MFLVQKLFTVRTTDGIWLGAIVRDLTDRKQAEEAIERANTELETRIRERTSQLELANREVEAFVHSVSHDLRSPLRGILSFASMLEEEDGEQPQPGGRQLLTRVRANARHMTNMIDDLLAQSRVVSRAATFESRMTM